MELTQHSKRILILWVLGLIFFFGYVYFATNEMDPEYRTNISLTTNQEIISVSVVIIVLAILSIILKGSTNRLTNLIGGFIVGIGFLAVLIDAVIVNFSGIYNLMMGIDVEIMIIIIVFAYRIPKSQA